MERRLTAILAADAVGDSDFDPPARPSSVSEDTRINRLATSHRRQDCGRTEQGTRSEKRLK